MFRCPRAGAASFCSINREPYPASAVEAKFSFNFPFAAAPSAAPGRLHAACGVPAAALVKCRPRSIELQRRLPIEERPRRTMLEENIDRLCRGVYVPASGGVKSWSAPRTGPAAVRPRSDGSRTYLVISVRDAPRDCSASGGHSGQTRQGVCVRALPGECCRSPRTQRPRWRVNSEREKDPKPHNPNQPLG